MQWHLSPGYCSAKDAAVPLRAATQSSTDVTERDHLLTHILPCLVWHLGELIPVRKPK